MDPALCRDTKCECIEPLCSVLSEFLQVKLKWRLIGENWSFIKLNLKENKYKLRIMTYSNDYIK